MLQGFVIDPIKQHLFTITKGTKESKKLRPALIYIHTYVSTHRSTAKSNEQQIISRHQHFSQNILPTSLTLSQFINLLITMRSPPKPPLPPPRLNCLGLTYTQMHAIRLGIQTLAGNFPTATVTRLNGARNLCLIASPAS